MYIYIYNITMSLWEYADLEDKKDLAIARRFGNSFVFFN